MVYVYKLILGECINIFFFIVLWYWEERSRGDRGKRMDGKRNIDYLNCRKLYLEVSIN